MDNFGSYLKSLREARDLSLRDVEREIQVSNAYLSQLESSKIKQPSPLVLHKLATLYGVSYESLMERVGYPAATTTNTSKTKAAHMHRLGQISKDEEIALLDYLAFIRKKNIRK
jgi:HTH-type transcriptional regulator, competence development regulator